MEFGSTDVHKDDSFCSSDCKNLSFHHHAILSDDVTDMEEDDCNVGNVTAKKAFEDDGKPVDSSDVGITKADGFDCEQRLPGFKLRLQSIFGDLLSVKVKEGIVDLFRTHCEKVPNSIHKQSELLIINLLQLLKKSIKASNSAKDDQETSSYVSGPYDDILEFLDVDSVPDSDNAEEEVIPDCVDDLCDLFLSSLDVNDMNFEPDDEI
ncbi:hypothetical protein ACP70R_029140 [Stipagrostis hirtigluma subsp. patula]